MFILNKDNARLRGIQFLKSNYCRRRDNAETMNEMIKFQKKIDELEKEEKTILKRCDVIL